VANTNLNATVSQAAVKGAGFASMVKQLREMLPPRAFNRMLEALSPETATLVRTPPMPVAWVPAACLYELYDAALRVGFDGDESRILELARRSIMADLKTVYRVFIRFASAKYVIDRGARLYDTYWRANGKMTVVEIGHNLVEIKYEGLVAGNRAFWIGQRGAVLGVIEATGLKAVDITITAGGGDERHCTLRVAWE
jgi:hypothetical protein